MRDQKQENKEDEDKKNINDDSEQEYDLERERTIGAPQTQMRSSERNRRVSKVKNATVGGKNVATQQNANQAVTPAINTPHIPEQQPLTVAQWLQVAPASLPQRDHIAQLIGDFQAQYTQLAADSPDDARQMAKQSLTTLQTTVYQAITPLLQSKFISSAQRESLQHFLQQCDDFQL